MTDFFNYGLLTISTVAFGLMFFFQDMFRANYGNTIKAAFVLNVGTNLVGVIVSLFTTGFAVEMTPFALIMSTIGSINNLLFSYCTLKALDKINLSLYSVFSMLGGMALPFLSGILFHGEAFTVAKATCFAFITVALAFTVNAGVKKADAKYYIGIFVLNGEAYCKKLEYHGGKPYLCSFNSKYSPIIIKPTDNLSVIGRVLL